MNDNEQIHERFRELRTRLDSIEFKVIVIEILVFSQVIGLIIKSLL